MIVNNASLRTILRVLTFSRLREDLNRMANEGDQDVHAPSSGLDFSPPDATSPPCHCGGLVTFAISNTPTIGEAGSANEKDPCHRVALFALCQQHARERHDCLRHE